MTNINLPIDDVLGELMDTLSDHTNAILIAPPGSGKTTRVPLALLHASWLGDRRILMLEPRRLAAKSVAAYMARQLGEQAGETVGYRVKMDTRVSKRTRIEVVTEGVLTSMLQQDPSLDGVGAVLFDEFHERSLHADLGLALCLQAQQLFREEMRLLVMSATMDAEPVSQILNHAPVIRGEGRMYPVETVYYPGHGAERLEDRTVRAVKQALQDHDGDMLVFLPGAGEIRRAERKLRESGLSPGVRVAPLYGNLPQAAQEAAIAPAVSGQRKIVLSTSIAETSLTVEGVRVVIDSGLMRVPRFSPRTGMTRLETVPVSRASADQRRGRAGRTAPGVCYRLWTEQEDRRLPPRSTPEVLEADLAPLALELAAWGVGDPAELAWLDLPPVPAYRQARELLHLLGAIAETGAVTPHGRRMAALGMHPRLAHMVLRAEGLGLARIACDLAAMLGERDVAVRTGGRAKTDADLSSRLAMLQEARTWRGADLPDTLGGMEIDPAICRRVIAEADHALAALRTEGSGRGAFEAPREEDNETSAAEVSAVEMCGVLLGFAYPDRIGQQRSIGKFTLANGRGAEVSEGQQLAAEPYLVAAELDDQGTESKVYLGAGISLEQINRYFADIIREEQSVYWDREAQTVRTFTVRKIGAVLIQETPSQSPDPELMLQALLDGIRQGGHKLLPWTKGDRLLQSRMSFMHKYDPANWPDVSDESLLNHLEDWLAPHVYGMRNRSDLQKIQIGHILSELIPWEQRQELDRLVPLQLTVPSGSRITLDYSDPEQPVLAARLQELFGMKETPRIAGGRVPVTIHLLSPARRPVQVTQDLASFWEHAYFEVKKDLKGRYPKHYWPDNPLEAEATNRTKPRK
ncbi:ATP-dependent helicase HrpB [Paenibacillus gansuensis]|uniref:ATP-dependent helicase HrpB n=1 Tax=Paenibacillus gansuensis TaxID=306542 RepID=A0ABW5PEX0_9BACL